jgi:RNA polymerase sigma factor (sigma-70 family)
MQLELKWKKYLLSSGKDRIKHRNVLFDYYRNIPFSTTGSFCKGRKYLDFHELLCAGERGLFKAIESYDPREGDFECYARTMTYCFILKENAINGRFPPAIKKSMEIIDDTKERYRLEHGRRPSDEKTAEMLGIDMQRYKDLEERVYFFKNRRREIEREDGMLLQERIELLEIISSLLTEKQKKVIYYHFYEGLNAREIGEIMGCTGSNVDAIKKSAIRRARKKFEVMGIRSAEDLGY